MMQKVSLSDRDDRETDVGKRWKGHKVRYSFVFYLSFLSLHFSSFLAIATVRMERRKEIDEERDRTVIR